MNTLTFLGLLLAAVCFSSAEEPHSSATIFTRVWKGVRMHMCVPNLSEVQPSDVQEMFWQERRNNSGIPRKIERNPRDTIIFNNRKTNFDGPILTLRDEENYEGINYECVLISKSKAGHRVITTLTPEPAIANILLKQPLEVSQEEGGSIDLTCGVNITRLVHPDQLNISWSTKDPSTKVEKPEKYILEDSRFQIDFEKTSQEYKKILRIKDFKLSDTIDDYKCRVSYKGDSNLTDISLMVKPKGDLADMLCFNTSVQELRGDEGSPIVLPCGINIGRITIGLETIFWTMDRGNRKSEAIEQSSGPTGRVSAYYGDWSQGDWNVVLDIKELQSSDAMTYHCNILTPKGRIRHDTKIIVLPVKPNYPWED